MVGGSMRISCGLGIRKPGNRRPHSQGIRSCGSYHKVDPSELVFRTCASQALREALKKLGTQVLEPIMQVELHRARGFPAGFPWPSHLAIATVLRGLTSGRGSFNTRFAHYERVPESLVPGVAKREPVYSG